MITLLLGAAALILYAVASWLLLGTVLSGGGGGFRSLLAMLTLVGIAYLGAFGLTWLAGLPHIEVIGWAALVAVVISVRLRRVRAPRRPSPSPDRGRPDDA